jgi:hypothetical protein
MKPKFTNNRGEVGGQPVNGWSETKVFTRCHPEKIQ